MPPPGFASGSSSQQAPAHVPKATQTRLKDALSRIRAALLTGESNRVNAKEFDAAEKAIDALLEDPNVTPPPSSLLTGEGASQQLSAQIAQKFNADLLDVFLKEMDQRDRAKLAALVSLLGQMKEFLGSAAIIMEWWDLVLRPVLKDPTVSDKVAASTRDLVVMAASAVPSSAYKDEPEPVPSWPSNADKPQARRTGDAPYPKTSTEPVGREHNRQRKSSSDENAGPAKIAQAATSKSAGSSFNMHRRFVQRLFDLYIQEASSPLGTNEDDDEKLEALEHMQSSTATLTTADADNDHSSQGYAGGGKEKSYLWHALQAEHTQPLDLAGTAWKGNLEAILITFGQDRPKEFFHHLSASFDEPIHRIPILLLLTIFARLNSIHTFHITSTKLVSDIMTSLQIDTSTTLISLCITALIMLIPQIPNWVANGGAGGVPVLLCVYARIVDWRKLGPGWEHRLGETDEMEALRRQLDEEFTEVERISKRLTLRADVQWRRLESSVDTDSTITPDAMRFFTIVYGLYPCNMIRFLRAPIDYLRRANCPSLLDAEWEELIDETSLQTRSEPILRKHTLHPAIVELTAEREITDKQRWLHHDAADTTAECLSLSVESWHSSAGHNAPAALDNFAGRARGRSIDPRESRSSSPGLPAKTPRLPDHSGADDILSSYTELRWGGSGSRRGSFVQPLSQIQTSQRRPSHGYSAMRQLQRAATSHVGAGFRSVSESPAAATRAEAPPFPLSQAETALHSQLQDLSIRRAQQSAPTSPTRVASPSATRGRPMSSWSNTISGLPAPFRTFQQAAPAPLTAGGLTGPAPPSPQKRASGDDLDSSVSPVAFEYQQQQRAAKLEVYAEMKYLQRENLLLRNELNFELYLKDQHLRHIGHLHRDRIKDSRLEAERQNLYQTVKLLRAQLVSLTASQERQRSEAATSKARHAQWENELNAKLKGYREDRKTWSAESRELKAQIENGKATIDAQAKRLEEACTDLFEVRTELDRIGPKAAKVAEYEAKVAQLTKCLTYWDDDVRKYEEQRREMETLLSRWREMEMLVRASEKDRWHISLVAENQQTEIKNLQRELQATRKRGTSSEEAFGESLSKSDPHNAGSDAPKAGSAASGDDASAATLQKRVEALEAELLLLKSQAEGQYAQADSLKHSPNPTSVPSGGPSLVEASQASKKELERMFHSKVESPVMPDVGTFSASTERASEDEARGGVEEKESQVDRQKAVEGGATSCTEEGGRGEESGK